MASFSAGTTFTDGVANDVTAAKLAALVNAATPTSGLIQDRTAETTIAADDTLLFGDFSDSSNLKRMTVANFAGTLPTATITSGTITTLNSTTGTIATLNSTTGTIATLNSTTGTIATLNSTTGTITNLSTTLAGDFTITQGTGTIGTGVVTAAKMANPQYTGFRNRIINGDMRIDQRNAGAAVTINTTGAIFSVDRFFSSGQATDGVFTLQQSSTAPSGFANSVIATVTTQDASIGATQFYLFNQYIEGANVADLAWGTASAKTVTLSFWVRSSLTGTFGGAISNSAQNRSYPFTYTISAANTYEYKTITIIGDTSGTWLTTTGIGIRLHFDLGVGSTYRGTAGAWDGATYLGAIGATNVIGTLNATWYITGVQLEAGSTATEFECRPIGTELALCYRYLPFFTLGNTTIGIIGQASATNTAYYTLPFQTTARTSPTGITLTTGTLRAFTAALATAGGTGAFNSAQTTQGQIVVTGATGLVAGNATYLNPSASMTILWTGCEL